MQQLQPNRRGQRVLPVPTARLRRHQGEGGPEVFTALGKLAVLPPKVMAHHVKKLALTAGQNASDGPIDCGAESFERRRGFPSERPSPPVRPSG